MHPDVYKRQLNSNKDKLVPPIVNIVAQVMKLTDKAKFKEMEIAGSKRIKNSSELDLTVYNGSQGINRGYTCLLYTSRCV